ncbi:Cas10/Cmr2 second palm domain-containing protein [Paenibacillus sp. FSL R7-0333]|uniref:Cas10/Cmr2 second palm domain-containing protein n=1 Tax=Paenibacillus sp. FSL R7-0333 TaxID=1926587 RepID=UPI00096E3BC6|nr:hypothetical protein BK146_15595 [Paenibacillus sp. FSL R7-0333]
MEQYVVAVQMDKVQSFLYDVLQAQIQQKQSNSGTLKEIMGASRFISEQFYKDIGLIGEEGKFFGHIDCELLKCSGMCIFVTHLSEREIAAKLKGLFEIYYEKFSGKLFMKYVYFLQADIGNNEHYQLEAIRVSKKRLNEKDCTNSMIEQNREKVFRFHPSPEKFEFGVLPLSAEQPAVFSDTINKLYSEQEELNENHFRIAVIKADLDGMGDRFKQIQSYETYRQVSELLSKYISIDYLSEIAKKYRDNDGEFRLFPLYIAGDDIFFAVPTSKLLDGINLCTDILKKINQEFQEINEVSQEQLQPLSVSIGVEFTFNREPIRYYYERVQMQLDYAKSQPGVESFAGIAPSNCVKISINEHVLYRYDLPKDESAKPGISRTSRNTNKGKSPLEQFKQKHADKNQWGHFVTQVKRLQVAMDEGFAAHHFFYGLLHKITDPEIRKSPMKYSNAVLYHVIPQYLGSNNNKLRETELLVMESLLKQVMVKKDGGRPESKLSFGVEQQRQLEKYVRLLLLFSDPRFKVMQRTDSKARVQNSKDFELKRVRSTVFNKTLRYLFEKNLGGWKERNSFRSIFVEHMNYSVAPENIKNEKKSTNGAKNKSPSTVEVYRTVRLSSSMLHRFKTIHDLKRIVEMIEATDERSKEEFEALEKTRKEEHKAPPGLYFDKDNFLRMARKFWNQDYVDSLLIFHQLREQLIQFRTHPSVDNKSGGQ